MWRTGCTKVGHYLEKPRGYHGEWSLSAGPKAKTPGDGGSSDFGTQLTVVDSPLCDELS